MPLPDLAKLETRLLESEQERANPAVYAWTDARAIRVALLPPLRLALRRLTDDALAEEFQTYCPFDGATTNDYRAQWVDLEGDQGVLARIAFPNLDLTQPFVEVMYATRSPRSENDLRDRPEVSW